MELKARLASLEHQINSLQNALSNDENYRNNFNIDYKNNNSNNINSNINNNNNNNNNNLKSILMRLKMEHQAVLQNIEKALEIVDCPNQSKTPERSRTLPSNAFGSSPQSPRLRDKINSVILGGGSPINTRRSNPSAVITSSPLSPAVEKSHITFDILNELDNQNTPPTKQRKVHFENGTGNVNEMSMASMEYLKKYGLL